jgi:hypothetical protein
MSVAVSRALAQAALLLVFLREKGCLDFTSRGSESTTAFMGGWRPALRCSKEGRDRKCAANTGNETAADDNEEGGIARHTASTRLQGVGICVFE